LRALRSNPVLLWIAALASPPRNDGYASSK
jgi:hypothetical protein